MLKSWRKESRSRKYIVKGDKMKMKKIGPMAYFMAVLFTLGFFGFCSDKTMAGNPENGVQNCPAKIPEKMACVPGGKFIMGSDSTKWKDENPQREIFVSTFLMDKYEVSTAEYQKCVQEKKCDFVQSNYRQMRGLNQPQLKANWFQAAAYCRAQGKRLPTEAEFEKAMRGPSGDLYPWGKEKPTCQNAVIMEGNYRGCTKVMYYHNSGSTQDVGSRPPGRYGLYDLAGNAQEWVSDWYEPDYRKCGQFCSGKNPQGPCDGKSPCPGYKEKVVKGGSWYWGWEWARGPKRRAYPPQNDPPHHFGFRCVKDVP